MLNRFKPYPWQKETWQLLVNAVQRDRLTHSFLFHGIAGLGKCDFAAAFSAYVLCDEKNKVSSCEVCQSCRWMKAGSHPDFFRVCLEENSKAIKVDQLRQLKDSLEKTSQRNGYQMAVIESAETMNRAAANALLKILEEPPGKVALILVADRLDTLPATIISRCQSIAFCASSNETAKIWLQNKIDGDINWDVLLRVSEGAPLRALKYVEQGYFELRDQLLQHLLCVQRHEINPIEPAADFIKQELSLLLIILMSLISDIVRLQQGVQPNVLSHLDRLPQLQTLAQAHNAVKLHEYFQICQNALSEAQSGIHINPQLLLENVFIEYYQRCDTALIR